MYSIQTNVSSLVAQHNLDVTSNFQQTTIERLTSGYRINSSGDDAAGLAVANGFRSKMAELEQGVRNANDGISVLQIVDGGLNNISKILDRLKTLAAQSASGTFAGNRATLDGEFQTLLGEIDRQAANAGLSAGGTYNVTLSIYIGGGTTQADSQVSVDLSTAAVDATSLTLGGTSVTSTTTALAALTAIDAAITRLGTAQGAVGTGQSELQYALQLAQSQIGSYTAAESRIRDTDIPTESANLTKAQTLQQAAIAALGQANSAPQAVLKLLQS